MAKKEIVEIDDSALTETPTMVPEVMPATTIYRSNKDIKVSTSGELVNCLTNERIIVKFVPKQKGMVIDPKHVLYGGMAETAVRWFTLPILDSGQYVNALTDSEKAYLEYIMGLEYNALSIYKKEDNFWDNLQVRLTKQDNYLDLSNPDDYIKYKILLANKNFIAPSLQVLQDRPKMTYQFVLVREGEESKVAKKEMNATMQSYMLFGNIQDDTDKLRVIIESIEGRPIAKTTKIEFLHTTINRLIQADPKMFISVVSDVNFDTKVLIKKGVEEGVISNRGGMFYLKSDGTPLCDDNEEPTMSIAAKFLNSPKRQTLKFSIEAKVKE